MGVGREKIQKAKSHLYSDPNSFNSTFENDCLIVLHPAVKLNEKNIPQCFTFKKNA